jgi:hypothetical protein
MINGYIGFLYLSQFETGSIEEGISSIVREFNKDVMQFQIDLLFLWLSFDVVGGKVPKKQAINLSFSLLGVSTQGIITVRVTVALFLFLLILVNRLRLLSLRR